MRIRFFAIALLVSATASLQPSPAPAQSLPPGQVSRRIKPKVVMVPQSPSSAQASPARSNPSFLAEMIQSTPTPATDASSASDKAVACSATPTSATITADERSRDLQNAIQKEKDAKTAPSRRAYRKLVQVEGGNPSPTACGLWAAQAVAAAVPDFPQINPSTAYDLALNEAQKQEGNLANKDDWAPVDEIVAAAGNLTCYATHSTASASGSQDNAVSSGNSANPKTPVNESYYFPGVQNSGFFPTFGRGCDQTADNAFFGQSGWIDPATTAQYLYNVEASENQVSSDLFTFTMPGAGIQVVLGSTLTSGGSTNSMPSTSATASMRRHSLAMRDAASSSDTGSTTTDSAATALSKLEQGGNFNLRVPIPLYSRLGTSTALEGIFSPNIGFTIDGIGSQQTITQATQGEVNLPLELYFQSPITKSQPASSSSSASPSSFFFDLKPSGEFIGASLAQKLGPAVPTKLFLVQAAAGFEFAGQFRFSAQYFWGNQMIFQAGSSGGSSTTSSIPTTSANGLHLVVSFAPQKGKSQNSSN